MVLTIPSGQTFIVKVTGYCRAQVSPSDVGQGAELVCKEDSGQWVVPGDEGRLFDRDAFAAIQTKLIGTARLTIRPR